MFLKTIIFPLLAKVGVRGRFFNKHYFFGSLNQDLLLIALISNL
jgi:hypothetical protein